MKKPEWKELVESRIEALKNDVAEIGQEEMLQAFLEGELERLDLFSNSETVGYKEELEDLFNRFQGHYQYENSTHFTVMSIL